METVAYRLPTRPQALAAANMLRSRGHSAGIPTTAVADHGTTLIIRASPRGLASVRALVESMFPEAVRCPDFNATHADEQAG